jgi:anaerobic selenocysteine-containing dehydrogenase
VAPRGEAKTEWEIFKALSQNVQERAIAGDVVEYLDGSRQPRRLDNLAAAFTLDGAYDTEEAVMGEWLRDSIEAGTLPSSGSLESLREKGTARFSGLGMFAPGLSLAADVRPDRTLTAYEWHARDGVPFPTLSRRAQFLIDHPWFAEAGEDLPCHKENPFVGGRYPLLLTSGHSRWTVHAVSMGNRVLADTHRGEPLAIIGTGDARDRGIEDGDMVRVSNDRGRYEVRARVSGRVRPGQLIVYNGWEPHQFKGWHGANEVEPGMVKWLHLVARYGHLRYLPFGWQPVPADRAVFVEVSRA